MLPVYEPSRKICNCQSYILVIPMEELKLLEEVLTNMEKKLGM